MISFSVMVTADLNNGQELAELPKQLQTKIEWNNLSGEILSNGYCPFVFQIINNAFISEQIIWSFMLVMKSEFGGLDF